MMDGKELTEIRKALGLSQAEFGERIGMSRVMVGLMERDQRPISARTEAAARSLSFKATSTEPTAHDPMERIIEAALLDAGVQFKTDQGGHTTHRLDFELDNGVAIEVKRFHSPRAIEQLSRVDNAILAQGVGAVNQLAELFRRAGIERRREKLCHEMEAIEHQLFQEPEEIRRDCGGLKRNWERLRREMQKTGVRLHDIDWKDGTTSQDYIKDI